MINAALPKCPEFRWNWPNSATLSSRRCDIANYWINGHSTRRSEINWSKWQRCKTNLRPYLNITALPVALATSYSRPRVALFGSIKWIELSQMKRRCHISINWMLRDSLMFVSNGNRKRRGETSTWPAVTWRNTWLHLHIIAATTTATTATATSTCQIRNIRFDSILLLLLLLPFLITSSVAS